MKLKKFSWMAFVLAASLSAAAGLSACGGGDDDDDDATDDDQGGPADDDDDVAATCATDSDCDGGKVCKDGDCVDNGGNFGDDDDDDDIVGDDDGTPDDDDDGTPPGDDDDNTDDDDTTGDPFPACRDAQGSCACRDQGCCLEDCGQDDTACQEACSRDFGDITCQDCNNALRTCMTDNNCFINEDPGYDADCLIGKCGDAYGECYCESFPDAAPCEADETCTLMPGAILPGKAMCVPNGAATGAEGERHGSCGLADPKAGPRCDETTICISPTFASEPTGECRGLCDEESAIPPAGTPCPAGNYCGVAYANSTHVSAVCIPDGWGDAGFTYGAGDGEVGGKCNSDITCKDGGICLGAADADGFCSQLCPEADSVIDLPDPVPCEGVEICSPVRFSPLPQHVGGMCIPEGFGNSDFTYPGAPGARGGLCNDTVACKDENSFCLGQTGEDGVCAVHCDDSTIDLGLPDPQDCTAEEACQLVGQPPTDFGACIPNDFAPGYTPSGADGERAGKCSDTIPCDETTTCIMTTGATEGVCVAVCEFVPPVCGGACPADTTCSDIGGTACGCLADDGSGNMQPPAGAAQCNVDDGSGCAENELPITFNDGAGNTTCVCVPDCDSSAAGGDDDTTGDDDTATGCKTDADCAAGETCDTATGACNPATGDDDTTTGCTSDADCAAGETCNTTTGACEAEEPGTGTGQTDPGTGTGQSTP